jgi:FSR family fosmidomycin resistance protein-like MFS transporter
MTVNEKKILVFTSAAHFLTHFFILIFPALVMPISRDLSLSIDVVIGTAFPMYLLYGVLAIPWGYLSDRYEPRWVMSAGLMVAGAGFFAAGMARTVTQLTLSLSLIGAGCSAYHPSGLALLSKGLRQRGRALGINGLFGNLGIAAAPFVAGVLSYLTGWGHALILLGIAGMITGILSFITPFSVERDRDIQQGKTVAGGDAVKLFIILCAAMLFTGLMYRGFTVILPTYLESKLTGIIMHLGTLASSIRTAVDTSPEFLTLVATTVTSAVYLLGMVGQLLGGKVADRFDLRWGYLIFFIVAFPFLIVIALSESWILIAATGLFALFTLGMQPIENSLVAMVTPPRWRSMSYGVKFTLVFGAGSLSVQMVSIVGGQYGLGSVIWIFPVFLTMTILMIGVMIWNSRGSSILHEH